MREKPAEWSSETERLEHLLEKVALQGKEIARLTAALNAKDEQRVTEQSGRTEAENTCCVLRGEIASQKSRIEELKNLLGEWETYVEEHKKEIKRLAAEKITNLTNALQALRDIQNGPPLIRDTEEWETAMKLADEVLKENDG